MSVNDPGRSGALREDTEAWKAKNRADAIEAMHRAGIDTNSTSARVERLRRRDRRIRYACQHVVENYDALSREEVLSRLQTAARRP